jgi:hypothetical protein
MSRVFAPLSETEFNILLAANATSRLDPQRAAQARRLIHFGLLTERSTGYGVTPEGAELCRKLAAERAQRSQPHEP